MIIAVDFDGTIIEETIDANVDNWVEIPGAIDTLLDLQDAGHTIILWTCRGSYNVRIAVAWLKSMGFVPDFVNSNANVVDVNGWSDKKIFAHMYLDDRSFPPFPGWDYVRRAILDNVYSDEVDYYSNKLTVLKREV